MTLPVTSHGSAYPHTGLDSADRVSSQTYKPQLSGGAVARVARRPHGSAPRVRQAAPPAQLGSAAAFCGGSGSDRLRRAQRTKARREWVQRAGAAPATVPMWQSRSAWVDSLRSWATDAVVRAVCARLGCSITSATLMSIAVVMAAHADHLTGRNMAATRGTIAKLVGCSSRTVTTAWRVLGETGWAVEASRGHGGPGVPGIGWRASVWHLLPRRRETSASVEFFHLPTPLGVGSFSPAGKNSPSARSGARRPDQAQKPKRRYRARSEPRPLALQRLADELVGNTFGRRGLLRGLHHGHIGAICDAITAAGIDPEAWTGVQIKAALEADMRQSGWSWPDRIERPGGFLLSRLRRLSRGGTAASLDKPQSSGPTPTPPAYVPEPHQPLTADQRTRIGRIQAEIRGRFAARRAGQQERSWPATVRRVVAPRPAAPHSGTCAHCGAPNAPARPFLPLSRAHVCEPCWGQQ